MHVLLAGGSLSRQREVYSHDHAVCYLEAVAGVRGGATVTKILTCRRWPGCAGTRSGYACEGEEGQQLGPR